MSRNWKQQQWKVCDNNGSKLRDEMKIEWQDLPLLGYGYFAKVVFKCWTKNIANWSGCWYVASNIWYFFSHEEWPRFGWENECVVQIVGIHEEGGKNHPPPLRPLLDRDHPYITSAKGLGRWCQKMSVFTDGHYCIYTTLSHSGWAIKCPTT